MSSLPPDDDDDDGAGAGGRDVGAMEKMASRGSTRAGCRWLKQGIC